MGLNSPPPHDLTAERAADLIQSVFLANEKQWRAWYALANSGSAQQSAPDGVAQKLMADKIGVDRKWIQRPGQLGEHFDICKSKRALAIANGAQEVTTQGVMDLMRRKREADPTKGARDE